MAKVVKAEMFSQVDLKNLPAGDWPGVWGGYEVVVAIGSAQYRMETDDGIRTPRADCIVHVTRHGEVTVETKEP